MVHQHFVLVDPFTVTENIILGDEGGAILDTRAAERRSPSSRDAYGFQIDPQRRRSRTSPSVRSSASRS